MATRQGWEDEVRAAYERIRKHDADYKIEVNGIEIAVFPKVFSPRYFSDSAWFAREVPNIMGKSSLLEIGTGTGIIALSAALNGSSEVYATDINPDAVDNANLNFYKHRIDIPVFEGDIFDPIPKTIRVDYIFWNHPFNNAEEPVKDMLLRAGFDHNYEGLKRYISRGRQYLNANGKLLLGTGGSADLDEMQRIADSNRFKPVLLRMEETEIISGSGIKGDLRIYHLEDLTGITSSLP
jgi:methylase of polypeptide subunit release factors